MESSHISKLATDTCISQLDEEGETLNRLKLICYNFSHISGTETGTSIIFLA